MSWFHFAPRIKYGDKKATCRRKGDLAAAALVPFLLLQVIYRVGRQLATYPQPAAQREDASALFALFAPQLVLCKLTKPRSTKWRHLQSGWIVNFN